MHIDVNTPKPEVAAACGDDGSEADVYTACSCEQYTGHGTVAGVRAAGRSEANIVGKSLRSTHRRERRCCRARSGTTVWSASAYGLEAPTPECYLSLSTQTVQAFSWDVGGADVRRGC